MSVFVNIKNWILLCISLHYFIHKKQKGSVREKQHLESFQFLFIKFINFTERLGTLQKPSASNSTCSPNIQIVQLLGSPNSRACEEQTLWEWKGQKSSLGLVLNKWHHLRVEQKRKGRQSTPLLRCCWNVSTEQRERSMLHCLPSHTWRWCDRWKKGVWKERRERKLWKSVCGGHPQSLNTPASLSE